MGTAYDPEFGSFHPRFITIEQVDGEPLGNVVVQNERIKETQLFSEFLDWYYREYTGGNGTIFSYAENFMLDRIHRARHGTTPDDQQKVADLVYSIIKKWPVNNNGPPRAVELVVLKKFLDTVYPLIEHKLTIFGELPTVYQQYDPYLIYGNIG